ncbi:MAG: OmpA family protein [Elusimicrobia bacterium]|nr:OmpA family protein [Elusimicrobiota bacterium]
MSTWEEREEDFEAQLNKGALWAITYGDLMSYLMVFFLILFAAKSSRSVDMQVSLKAMESHFGKQSALISELFSHKGIQRIAKLDVTENRIRIVFLSPVLFDSGSAELKDSSLEHLRKLAEAMKELPNPVQIEGHTDNQRLGRRIAFASNWELSAARAFAVLRFLEKAGVPPERLSAIGYGEFKPQGSNETPEGRAANRRIEVSIVRRES